MTSGSGSAVGDQRRSGSGEGTRATPGETAGMDGGGDTGAGAVGGLLASGPTDNTRATPGDVARSTLGIGGGGDTAVGDTGAAPPLTRTGE